MGPLLRALNPPWTLPNGSSGSEGVTSTATFGLATITLRLRFGSRPKPFLGCHETFLCNHLQRVMSDWKFVCWRFNVSAYSTKG